MTNEMIPISEIDKTIEKILDSETNYRDFEVVDILTNLSKKAIPAVSHEKIDEKIKELKESIVAGPAAFFTKDGVEWAKELHDAEIRILEDLKK